MTFLVAIVLIAIAVALVIAGFAMSSTTMLMSSAFVSGLAVIAIWRWLKLNSVSNFVSSPPPVSEPTWNQPIFRVDEPDADASSADGAGVGESDEPVEASRTDQPNSLYDVSMPIDNYDELLASELLPSLETLSVEELRDVIRWESKGLRRAAIINRAARLIDLTENSIANEEHSLRASRVRTRDMGGGLSI